MNRLEYLMQLLAEQPHDAFTLFALAKEHEKMQDLEKALEYYTSLREKHPDYVGLYYHLGKLQEKTAALEVAADTYRQGMEVAKAANDRHAFGELNGALLEID
jgi:tetratricopeptide (TPR) repeat protein